MTESSEAKALEKISTEVGHAQIKITLSSQCIKAQAFLVDKLRKQSERQKQICSYINSNNLRLQTEIRHAELEIKSLMLAKETIKTANVELKKECLLIKERKIEIEERVKERERTYEDLWLQAKARYESIPYVQNLLQAQNKTQNLKCRLHDLEDQSEKLIKEIEIKRKVIKDLNNKRTIEIAQYIVNDLPKAIKILKDKTTAIKEISENINKITKRQENELNDYKVPSAKPVVNEKLQNEIKKSNNIGEDGWWVNLDLDISQHSIMMPQIQLMQSEFDELSTELDKIKKMKTDMLNITPAKRIDRILPESGIQNKKTKKEDEFSIYFDKTNSVAFRCDLDNRKENFAQRKLINILEDIKLDKNDAYEMISNVNPNKLKDVQKIGKFTGDEKNVEEQIHDDVEEIDLTKSADHNNILVPPTQFLDYGEDFFSSSHQQVEVIVHMSMTDSTGKESPIVRNSQDDKKRVCFDLPMTIQEINDDDENIEEAVSESHETAVITKEIEAVNETVESQLDTSQVSETHNKMKDMILKQNNLDLSPQFVYGKNTTFEKANTADEKIITSKFFPANSKDTDKEKLSNNNENCNMAETKSIIQDVNDEPQMKTAEVVVSSPKMANTERPEKTVTGLLFNHGVQGIPDSLNVSISTTGIEEGDPDFPQCIDSSLLLSPKADFPMPNTADNARLLSQEVPNFLSGLRKTAFSFFGQPAADSKANPSEQNQNNFKFNFGGDDKKGRGGLFSMFR